MAVVVVFPCVPLTTMECFPGRNSSSMISGSDRYESLRSSIFLDFHVAARNRVTHNDKIRRGREMLRINYAVAYSMPRDSRNVEAGG